MPEVRTICGDRQARSPGPHAWGGAVGDVGGYGRAGEVVEEVKDPDGDYIVNLVEAFFANLDMR